MKKLPDGWRRVTVSACCENLDGRRKPINSDDRASFKGEVPYYGANGLVDFVREFIFDEPLLLVAEDGGHFDEFSSRPIAYQIHGKSWVNNHAHVLRAKAGFGQDFIFYCLEHRDIRRFLNGGTRAKLNKGELDEIALDIPSDVREQNGISEVFQAWSVAIRVVGQLVEKQQARKVGLMQQLLTGQTRFREFKGDPWRSVRIAALLEECDRYVDWSDDTAYQFASIRRRSGGLFDRGTFHGREVKTKVLKLLKAGDFVISKRQVVHGAWALVTKAFDGFGVSDEYDVLVNRDPKVLDMRFFNYLSQTRRLWHMAYLASNGVHIEKLIFDFDDFAKDKVRIPPTVEEQARIVDVVSTCDREIDLLQRQLDALKEQKRGLMQKLLTGEVRVKV